MDQKLVAINVYNQIIILLTVKQINESLFLVLCTISLFIQKETSQLDVWNVCVYMCVCTHTFVWVCVHVCVCAIHQPQLWKYNDCRLPVTWLSRRRSCRTSPESPTEPIGTRTTLNPHGSFAPTPTACTPPCSPPGKLPWITPSSQNQCSNNKQKIFATCNGNGIYRIHFVPSTGVYFIYCDKG